MINLYVDKSDNKIKLETTDLKVKYFLEVKQDETKYIPWQKRWGTVSKLVKIYDSMKKFKDGSVQFTLGLGWAAYLCNVFRNEVLQDTYEKFVKDAIISENSRTIPFQELRDYQNEDVLHILKYKIGLFNVYTSYGKFIYLPLYVEIYR